MDALALAVRDSEGGRCLTSPTPWPIRVRNTVALQIVSRDQAPDAMPVASCLKTVTFCQCSVAFHASKVGA
jgi:hypothetical protein